MVLQDFKWKMKVLKHLSENYNFRSEEIKETKERKYKITNKKYKKVKEEEISTRQHMFT